jgi:glycosyltransferase
MAIKSVASQSYRNVEHIIVDGLSNDNTLEIVAGYSHTTAQVVSEKDMGIYDAMNKGIQLATGDVIGFLNADDLYENEHVLSKVAGVFDDTAVEACYGDLVYVDATNTNRVVRYWSAGNFMPEEIINGWMIPHPTFFVRKRLYQEYGVFCPELRIAGDYELIIRFLLKHNVQCIYVPEVLVRMRTGGISNRNLKNLILGNLESYRAWGMNGIYINPLRFISKPLSKVKQFIKRK